MKGISVKTFYFHEEGKINLPKTIALVKARVKSLGINKIVIFTGDGEGPLKAAKALAGLGVKIIAVSFPYKQEIEESGDKRIIPRTSLPEVQEALRKHGIQLVLAHMPLNGIILPGIRDPLLYTMRYTLKMFSGGLRLCVEAITMATDAGALEPGEEVVAMSADTAIVATASSTQFIFHPTKGLDIREIICKPRYFTISHKLPDE